MTRATRVRDGLAVLTLVLTACGDGGTGTATQTTAATTTAAPTSTTGAPATTSAAATTTPPTTVPAPATIDLAVAIQPTREPSAVLAEFAIGDGDGELGIERPHESEGSGPANPVLLAGGSVMLSDGVNTRFVVVGPDGESVVSPSPLVTAACTSVGPAGVVYVASGAMRDGGISAFVVGADGSVTRVAGPSGPGASMSPAMGEPAAVPAFVDGEAVAAGTQPLAVVDATGTPLDPATLFVPDVIRVERGDATVADGIAYTLTRSTAVGVAAGTWTIHLPVSPDASWGPSLIWLALLGDDGVGAAWDVMVDGSPAFLVVRLGPDGLVDAFTVPVTWRWEGGECKNPVADDDRLVSLVPATATGRAGDATVGFRLLEWRWDV